MGITTREILFAQRPEGEPTLDTFELTTRELREPADGDIVVRNRWLSVDPYMRGRMSTARSYVAGFELGKALQGGAVGEVIASKAEGFAPGDLVVSTAAPPSTRGSSPRSFSRGPRSPTLRSRPSSPSAGGCARRASPISAPPHRSGRAAGPRGRGPATPPPPRRRCLGRGASVGNAHRHRRGSRQRRGRAGQSGRLG